MADTSPYAEGGFLNVPVGTPVVERQPLRHTDDPEAENAVAEIVTAHTGFTRLSVRYRIASDTVRWFREHRPPADDRIERALAVLNGAPIPMGEVRARHAAAILRGDRG